MSASDVKDPKKKLSAGARLSKLVDRTIQRNIKGVEYFVTAAPPVGLTPKETVFTRGTARLYHYRPVADEIYRVPILMVMATTNRAYVFDIAEQNSFVGFLTKQGYDVYVLDWEAPRPEEHHLRFEDYTQDFIPDAIRKIQKRSGEKDVNLVGYCMGGVLSLMYAATHPDGPLKNLVTFTTPVDFREMGLFAHMSKKKHFDVDRLVDAVGNIPPDMLMASFEMLAPTKKSSSRVDLWQNMHNNDYVENHRKFDRWSNDMLPLAGEYFRQTTKDLMWDNKLFEGTLKIGGKSADLANITVPVFSALAQHDHIVPFAASAPLIDKVSSEDKTQIVLKGGHISLIAGLNAVTRLWPVLDEWLSERSV